MPPRCSYLSCHSGESACPRGLPSWGRLWSYILSRAADLETSSQCWVWVQAPDPRAPALLFPRISPVRVWRGLSFSPQDYNLPKAAKELQDQWNTRHHCGAYQSWSAGQRGWDEVNGVPAPSLDHWDLISQLYLQPKCFSAPDNPFPSKVSFLPIVIISLIFPSLFSLL